MEGPAPSFWGGAFIWAFRNGKPPFMTSIRKIAQEDNFYSREIEKFLANEVEGPANKVIRKIREHQIISQDEKLTLAKYMMVMWKRVPETKGRLIEKAPEVVNPVLGRISKELIELRDLYPDKRELIDKRLSEIKEIGDNKIEEIIYDSWLQSIPPEKTPQSIDALSQMTWRFAIAVDGYYFITSDNPLFFFREMGIGKEKSEVSFPISKDIAVWSTWRTDIGEGYFQARSQIVKELNRRTASTSTQFLYSPFPDDWIQLLANKPKNSIKLNRIT